MPQIFHPATNAFVRGTIFGGVFIIAGVAWAGGLFVRSNYVTEMDVVRDQPVPFSHDHHVGGLGLDCRYCHATVETSPFAGMPATEVCMGCHAVVWKDSPLLAPLRESARTGQPMRWTRVYDLPDFVYFNHSIHVAKGIGCESCHGRVDKMPLMRKTATLHMEWCLECHRNPEAHVREKADVFAFGQGETSVTMLTRSASEEGQASGGADAEKGPHGSDPTATSGKPLSVKSVSPQKIRDAHRLVKQYGIAKGQITDCAVCHR